MKKQNKLIPALTVMLLLCVLMGVCIAGFHTSPHVPLIFACIIAGAAAVYCRTGWDDLLAGIKDGIYESLEAVLILMLIGILIGTWIACASVQTVIYYGLAIISAKLFLPATMLICALVGFVIGSWGTVGTVGLAFMGIGMTLGLPAPAVAGAIVSGAYLGEVISPLSDAVNLVSAVTGESTFKLSKVIKNSAALAFVIAEAVYFAIGFASKGGNGDISQGIEPVKQALSENFNLGILALLPIVAMFACVVRKVPAIVSVIVGIISALVLSLFTQDVSAEELLSCLYDGYICSIGNQLIDGLLTAGGLGSMMYTIGIILLAMSFGGIMKVSGMMDALVSPVATFMRSRRKRDAASTVIGALMNLFMSDQFLAISFTGQMFAGFYKEDGEELGKCLLQGSAPTSPLVPWNSCGIYVSGILGVSAFKYGMFAVFNYALPFLGILMALVFAGKKEGKRG